MSLRCPAPKPPKLGFSGKTLYPGACPSGPSRIVKSSCHIWSPAQFALFPSFIEEPENRVMNYHDSRHNVHKCTARATTKCAAARVRASCKSLPAVHGGTSGGGGAGDRRSP